MHIHHRTDDGRALVSLPVKWEESYIAFPEMVNGKPTGVLRQGDYRVVHGSDVYRAVRCRTEWGWCSFEVYRNGERISPINGGELPSKLEVHIPMEDALKGGCSCGCCVSRAERAEYFRLKDAADKLELELRDRPWPERYPVIVARKEQETFWQAAVAKSMEVR